jgi:hypothetical protein
MFSKSMLGQLQKMGILPSKSGKTVTPGSSKRRSAQVDFGTLNPLKPTGTVGFSAFRDNEAKATRSRKHSNGDLSGNIMDEDSEDDDDDNAVKMEEADDKDVKQLLSPEDAKRQGELADGVGRIKVSSQDNVVSRD